MPYLFTDVACAWYGKNKSAAFLDAEGAGLQVKFESPVFAFFNMAFGINHHGKWKINFAAVQSF